jgi:hypothetical protein
MVELSTRKPEIKGSNQAKIAERKADEIRLHQGSFLLCKLYEGYS